MPKQPLQTISLRIRLGIISLLHRLQLSPKVYYVGSNEVLPPPLTSEEEQDLLIRLQAGDLMVRTPLIERNLRLVVYIARKFENTGISIEDLVSIGTIGLIKAVNTFDPSKNIKLATYASRCIENEILMYLRRTSKLKAEVSFDEPLNVDWDGNELVLADVVGNESDILRHIEKEVDKALLTTALQQLTGREKRIMELRFGLQGEKERTQREVADLLGISQSYISRLEKKILKKLRREMKKME
ncbi:MAG: RNA polymerase sporulation sigma factor SigE [Bacillota bacterium]|jgi:RNA polymerase sporulation-specific sigma factor|nr:RNA polymerase sporulation sigma factor SigE [Bacillota bacterium]HHT90275.1 RNA polymerase sporulation sigma factor SigE [Bacillota bacterium]